MVHSRFNLKGVDLNHRAEPLVKGVTKVSTPFSKLMLSMTNLCISIDQNMPFCRGEEELSFEKKNN
jgi:hypothetical protein